MKSESQRQKQEMLGLGRDRNHWDEEEPNTVMGVLEKQCIKILEAKDFSW